MKLIQLIISDAVGLLSGRKSDVEEDQRSNNILKQLDRSKETSGGGVIEEIEFLKVESDTSWSGLQPRYFISHRDRRISSMFDYDPGMADGLQFTLEHRHSRENPSPRRHRRTGYEHGLNCCNKKIRLDMSPLPLQTMFVIQRVLQRLAHLGVSVEKPQWLFLHTVGMYGA